MTRSSSYWFDFVKDAVFGDSDSFSSHWKLLVTFAVLCPVSIILMRWFKNSMFVLGVLPFVMLFGIIAGPLLGVSDSTVVVFGVLICVVVQGVQWYSSSRSNVTKAPKKTTNKKKNDESNRNSIERKDKSEEKPMKIQEKEGSKDTKVRTTKVEKDQSLGDGSVLVKTGRLFGKIGVIFGNVFCSIVTMNALKWASATIVMLFLFYSEPRNRIIKSNALEMIINKKLELFNFHEVEIQEVRTVEVAKPITPPVVNDQGEGIRESNEVSEDAPADDEEVTEILTRIDRKLTYNQSSDFEIKIRDFEVVSCRSESTRSVSFSCVCRIVLEQAHRNETSKDIIEGMRIELFQNSLFWNQKVVAVEKKSIIGDSTKVVLSEYFEIVASPFVDSSRTFRRGDFKNKIKVFHPTKGEYKVDYEYFYFPETLFAPNFQNFFRLESIKSGIKNLRIKTSGPSGAGKSLVLYYICRLYKGPSDTSCTFWGGDSESDNTQKVLASISGKNAIFYDQMGDYRITEKGREMFSRTVQTLLVSRCFPNLRLSDIFNNVFTETDLLSCNYPINKLLNKEITTRKEWSQLISQQFHSQIAVFKLTFFEDNENEKHFSEYSELYKFFEANFNIQTLYVVFTREPTEKVNQNKHLKKFIRSSSNLFLFRKCFSKGKKTLECDPGSLDYLECLECLSENYRTLGDLIYASLRNGETCIQRFRPEFETKLFTAVEGLFQFSNLVDSVARDIGLLS